MKKHCFAYLVAAGASGYHVVDRRASTTQSSSAIRTSTTTTSSTSVKMDLTCLATISYSVTRAATGAAAYQRVT